MDEKDKALLKEIMLNCGSFDAFLKGLSEVCIEKAWECEKENRPGLAETWRFRMEDIMAINPYRGNNLYRGQNGKN